MAELRKLSYWMDVFFTWVILIGVFLLFTSSLERIEVYVGIGAAAIAAIASAVFESLGVVAFRPRLRDLIQAWRIPWYMLTGSWELLKATAMQMFTRRGAQSIVFGVPFDMGLEKDPPSAARRALAVVYTTMTPNFVVLGLDGRNQLMLYHQVLSSPVLEMTKELGART